ncbi:Bax inhibitor-1/YccA family protein [Nocardioides sp.]|uniref:Bax inhibitor-1/YccA family protein n=1 Tax=Nocardioides sp. TaxID=35761 RepID=UPI0035670961
MKSNNPIFSRSEEFSRPTTNQYGNQTYAGGAPTVGFGEPGSAYPAGSPTHTTGQGAGLMTIDSVVQKTAIALGVVMLTAAATWIMTPDIANLEAAGTLYAALTIGGLGAFALSMVNSFKRVISPPLVLLFCVFEGVALGAFSKVIDASFSTADSGNLVVQAVLGTFAAFAGTLAAYKVFDIKVGNKFRMFVIAAVFGMVGLSIMELILGMFSSSLGLFGFGALGMVFALVGLVLGVFMLILDFDFVEQGIANQLPEAESWRAAFAITVALVWIYTNLLRLLAMFNSD